MNDELQQPEPDDKDWTWVIERECPDCGFDASRPSTSEFAAIFSSWPDQWREVLERDDVRVRPEPKVWSPLEYACHVRDVLALTDFRLRLMLDHDNPVFANWDQDETALESEYPHADPSAVGEAIAANTSTVVAILDGLDGSAWSRPGVRSNGSLFTIESFSRYILHDPIHHYWDVTGSRATT